MSRNALRPPARHLRLVQAKPDTDPTMEARARARGKEALQRLSIAIADTYRAGHPEIADRLSDLMVDAAREFAKLDGDAGEGPAA